MRRHHPGPGREIQRGGMPCREDLRRTVDETEKVLADLTSVRDELRRLLIEFSQADLKVGLYVSTAA